MRGIEVYSDDDPIGAVDFALLVALAWFVPPVVR
jgi:hypothetical protein